MKLKVTVTQEDIDKGCRSSQTACPVARAIRALFKGDMRISVSTQSFFIEPRGKEKMDWHFLPPHVTRWIIHFDTYDHAKQQPKPFSFTLNIPDVLKEYLR